MHSDPDAAKCPLSSLVVLLLVSCLSFFFRRDAPDARAVGVRTRQTRPTRWKRQFKGAAPGKREGPAGPGPGERKGMGNWARGTKFLRAFGSGYGIAAGLARRCRMNALLVARKGGELQATANPAQASPCGGRWGESKGAVAGGGLVRRHGYRGR